MDCLTDPSSVKLVIYSVRLVVAFFNACKEKNLIIRFYSYHRMKKTPSVMSGTMPVSTSHANALMRNMWNMYQSRRFTDVTILVEKEVFHVHAVVLDTYSKLFSNILQKRRGQLPITVVLKGDLYCSLIST